MLKTLYSLVKRATRGFTELAEYSKWSRSSSSGQRKFIKKEGSAVSASTNEAIDTLRAFRGLHAERT